MPIVIPGLILSRFGAVRFEPVLKALLEAGEAAGQKFPRGLIGDFAVDALISQLGLGNEVFSVSSSGEAILDETFDAETAVEVLTTFAEYRKLHTPQKPKPERPERPVKPEKPLREKVSLSKLDSVAEAIRAAGVQGIGSAQILRQGVSSTTNLRKHLTTLLDAGKIEFRIDEKSPGQPRLYYWVEQVLRRERAPLPVFEESVIVRWDAQLAAIPDDRHGLETLDEGLANYVGVYRGAEFVVVVEDFEMEPYLEKAWRIERREVKE